MAESIFLASSSLQRMMAPRGPAQGLVGGRRDNVRVGDGGGVGARGHKAADVGHVHEHVGTDLVAYLAYALPVYYARIGARAGDYHLRAQLERHAAHLVVVDEFGFTVHAVAVHVEIFAGDGGLGAVSQVPAAGEVHAHDHVAGLAERQVDGDVGLRAGVGLHVGMLGAEELLGPLAGDVLHHVHIFAAAVEAPAGVALGVLVRQVAARGLHHSGGGEILAGDELDVVALALQLLGHGGEDLLVLAAQVFIVHVCVTTPRPVFLFYVFVSFAKTRRHYTITCAPAARRNFHELPAEMSALCVQTSVRDGERASSRCAPRPPARA